MDSWSTVRTDLALEARESIEDKAEGLHGVTVEEDYDETSDVRITKVTVETKNGAKILGKPMGIYITLEAPSMTEPEEDYHQEISEILASNIRSILPEPDREHSILVVGLGNREVTADSRSSEIGCVGEDMVLGMLAARIWPLVCQQAYRAGVRQSGLQPLQDASGQQFNTGCYGKDGNGIRGDHQGSHQRNAAGYGDRDRRFGGAFHQAAEPHHTDHQHGDPSGVGRGQSQERHHAGEP